MQADAGKVRIYRTNRRGGNLVYTKEAIQKAAYSHLPKPFSNAIILEKGAVVTSDDTIDITDTIIRLYDARSQ